MNARVNFEAMNFNPVDVPSSMLETVKKNGLSEERLPFTVRMVRNEEQLEKAVYIRQSAYGRHLKALAEVLKQPEPSDREDGSVVLLAESKLDGSPLGTIRLHSNRYKKLPLEDSVNLPEWLQGKSIAEATRLGVCLSAVGQVVKTALFKGFLGYCAEHDIEWMVCTGRSPLDRQYRSLGYEDIFPEQGFIPMRHVGNIPHRVMALQVPMVEPRWAATKHPLYDFFFRTYHPDIAVVGTEAVVGRELVSPNVCVQKAKSYRDVAMAA